MSPPRPLTPTAPTTSPFFINGTPRAQSEWSRILDHDALPGERIFFRSLHDFLGLPSRHCSRVGFADRRSDIDGVAPSDLSNAIKFPAASTIATAIGFPAAVRQASEIIPRAFQDSVPS